MTLQEKLKKIAEVAKRAEEIRVEKDYQDALKLEATFEKETEQEDVKKEVVETEVEEKEVVEKEVVETEVSDEKDNEISSLKKQIEELKNNEKKSQPVYTETDNDDLSQFLVTKNKPFITVEAKKEAKKRLKNFLIGKKVL